MKNMFRASLLTGAVLALVSCTPATEQAATSQTPSVAVAGGPPVMRRLTEGEYKRIVSDIFGATVKPGGRFEPDLREAGLLEVGASRVSVTAAGFEQYDTTARNVAAQEGRRIARFTTGVFDLVPLPDERQREAAKDDPAYYYRPFKTILVRTVRDGGESHYVCGDHRATLPTLYRLLNTGLRDGT